MKLHKIRITTPGHFVLFAGKKLRTPVIFEKVSEENLLLLKSQIRQQNLKYILDDEESYVNEKQKEQVARVEELYSSDQEEKSVLRKLLEIEWEE